MGKSVAIKILKWDGFSVIVVLIIMSAIMSFFSKTFLTINNMNVIAQAFSITAIVGLAQMVIIGTGGMNLSVGGIGGLSGVVCGLAMAKWGFPIYAAILLALAIGIVCGMLNGFLIMRGGCTGIAAFLITMASCNLFAGIKLGITKAVPVNGIPDAFSRFGAIQFLGFPLIMYVAVAIVIVVFLFFKYISLGRRILAIGSNMNAATLYGVSAGQTTIIAHTISGLLSACAAILLVARLGSAQTDIGNDWMMFSFAAPIIGGTRQSGGKVNVFGTLLGAIVLAMIDNSLVHLNVSAYWTTFIQGTLILTAVAFDQLRSIEKKGKKEKKHGKQLYTGIE